MREPLGRTERVGVAEWLRDKDGVLVGVGLRDPEGDREPLSATG